MIGGLPSLEGLPSWQPPGKLSDLGRPTHALLSSFIRRCSPDPDTRTVAITALVLGLWQLKGSRLTSHVPSLLLVNAGEATDDPVDEFTRGLVYDGGANRPGVRTSGAFTCGAVGLAPEAMRNALVERQSLGAVKSDDLSKLQRARELEERFRAAQVTGYGLGRCRPYSEAWDEEHGLLIGEDDQIILRLNGAPDRAAFRDDVLDDPARLVFPTGVGDGLLPAAKGISLSGSLPAELCSGEVVSHTVALGLPFFLLPHTAEDPLVGGTAAIENLAKIWQHEPVTPVSPTLRLPPPAAAHEASLRRHLARLPATYEFAVLQAAHQLDGVCDRIARFAGGGEAGMEELAALCGDLYDHTVRGMAISVAGLSYFGRGLNLEPGCEPLRSKAIKLLHYLRKNGPTACSLLLKNVHLKKRERDALLERLGEERLVEVEGGKAAATGYGEFTTGLYAREEFSLAKDRSAE
jgi:hypothetical protein